MKEVTFKTHIKTIYSGNLYCVIVSFNCDFIVLCAKQKISVIKMKDWERAKNALEKRGAIFSVSADLKLLNFNDLCTIRKSVKFDW